MTRHAYLVGQHISNSLSPAIHNAAAEALSLDWRYELLDVNPQEFPLAIARLRESDCAGANITMPYKFAAAGLADVCSHEVRRSGAANVLVKQGRELVAHNTDVAGLDALLSERAGAIADRDAVVLGAGGAAIAALLAFERITPRSVVVVARRLSGARSVAQKAKSWLSVPVTGIELSRRCLSGAGLIINATALGMNDEALPFAPADLCAGQLIYDFAYRRNGETSLVREGRARGAEVCDGAAHLLAQAGPTFALLTGVSPARVAERAASAALAAALGRTPRTWAKDY